MIHDGVDPGDHFWVLVVYAYCLMFVGRLSQAIEAFDHIVELTGGDPHVGREVISFSPLIWADSMGALTLAQAGRFDECWPRVERAIRMAREHNAQENLAIDLVDIALCAYFARGTSRVPDRDLLRLCLEGLEVAEVLGNRHLQITTSCGLATAHFLIRDYDAAEARLTEPLAQARFEGNALDWHGYYLAVFADSCLARGDAEAAIAKARELVDFADAGGLRYQAALGRAALADALLHAGAPEHEVAAVIAAARELVEATGGNSLLPRLRETEVRLAARADPTILTAGLRDAEAMYRAIGAPDPAERLAQEIGQLGEPRRPQ
jgi:tetratricopeptide (TPR) repeat protein